jgi:tRNA pseudouridine38-40 synthase
MARAAALLVGDHDFSSFQGADSVEHNPLRTVLRSTVRRLDEFLVYEIEARSFLRHMVRNIMGTLVDVGRGALSVEDFARILAARDRTRAGMNAPPQGLFLVAVKYEEGS